jgi:hypothetical protein
MSTDVTTHAWKGVCPFEYFVSVIDAAGPNQGDVSGGVHAHGTEVLTRALKKP